VRFWWNRFGPIFAARRMKTLQKFASVHGSVHNHFNQERHLISREQHKKRRSRALAERRAVMA
jgi:putative transposase